MNVFERFFKFFFLFFIIYKYINEKFQNIPFKYYLNKKITFLFEIYHFLNFFSKTFRKDFEILLIVSIFKKNLLE
jgi:hypothetical protein